MELAQDCDQAMVLTTLIPTGSAIAHSVDHRV